MIKFIFCPSPTHLRGVTVSKRRLGPAVALGVLGGITHRIRLRCEGPWSGGVHGLPAPFSSLLILRITGWKIIKRYRNILWKLAPCQVSFFPSMSLLSEGVSWRSKWDDEHLRTRSHHKRCRMFLKEGRGKKGLRYPSRVNADLMTKSNKLRQFLEIE